MLNEQMKNHGYNATYDMVMNLARAMLAGRSLEAFLNERRAKKQKTKRTRRRSRRCITRNKFMIVQFLNWQSVLLTSKVDEEMPMRGRENMRRDLFMGKVNPEKISQILQDLNKYLDYIPIERKTLSDKTIKAYVKSFPEDEIRSIMG
jgi:hypothetical protein